MVANTTVVESYRGAEITFGGDGWVNATQMGKPFGKRPNDFLSLPGSKQYRSALSAETGLLPENLVIARAGRGASSGTWMHPDIALEFARWLSPEFAIWCNRVVRRVLSGGLAGVESATILNVLERVVATVDRMAARIERLEGGQPVRPLAAPLGQPTVLALRDPAAVSRVAPAPDLRAAETCRLLKALLGGEAKVICTKRDVGEIAVREKIFPWLHRPDPKDFQTRASILHSLWWWRKNGIDRFVSEGITYRFQPFGETRCRRYLIERIEGGPAQ